MKDGNFPKKYVPLCPVAVIVDTQYDKFRAAIRKIPTDSAFARYDREH